MTDDDGLAATLGLATTMKEQLVRREGAGSDIAPMLELRHDGVLLSLVALIGDRDTALRLVGKLVALSDADQAVMIMDSYGQAFAADDAPNSLEVGELGQRFAAGDPSVYEALHLVSMRRDGSCSALQLTYTYDRRNVVWGEQVDLDLAASGGAYPAVLRTAFEAQLKRPVPALMPQQMADLLGCEMLVPTLTPPPRNRPCPCGSETKAKHCCWSGTK